MVMVENLEQLALIKKPQQCFALHATSGYRSRRDTMAPDPPWDRIVLNLCRVVSGGVVEEPGFVFVEVGDGGVGAVAGVVGGDHVTPDRFGGSGGVGGQLDHVAMLVGEHPVPRGVRVG